MKRLLLAGLLGLASLFPAFAVPCQAADTVMADPPPSIDNPRKIVVTLSDDEIGHMNEVLSNIGNIQKFYGADYVRLALIAYGPGLRALLKAESPVTARIKGLMAIDVEIIACGATLAAMHKSEADLIEGVKVVPNGLPEVAERQLRGWVYLHP